MRRRISRAARRSLLPVSVSLRALIALWRLWQGRKVRGLTARGTCNHCSTSVSLRATIVLWYRHIQLQAASSLLQA